MNGADGSGEGGDADANRPPSDPETGGHEPDPTTSNDSSDGGHDAEPADGGQPSPADKRATEARILRILAGGMNLIGGMLL